MRSCSVSLAQRISAGFVSAAGLRLASNESRPTHLRYEINILSRHLQLVNMSLSVLLLVMRMTKILKC